MGRTNPLLSCIDPALDLDDDANSCKKMNRYVPTFTDLSHVYDSDLGENPESGFSEVREGQCRSRQGALCSNPVSFCRAVWSPS